MFDTHFMIRTDNGTLEQTPNAFDAVSVNVANNPFLCGVINPLVFRVGILNSPIGGHFVSIDSFRVRRGVVVDELMQHGLGCVRDDLQSNHAIALNCSDSDSLVAFVAPAVSAHLPADVRFIHFYNPSKKLAVNLAHRSSDSMAKIPSRLVSNTKRPFHLKRAHAFLRFGHQINREKPFRQRKVRIVKDCTASCRKLIAALVTVVLIAINYLRNALRLAAWTSNTARPAQTCKLCSAFFIASELLNKLRKVHVAFEGFGRFCVHSYA